MIRFIKIIVDLIKYFIPKFHNKITGIIVIAGIGLIAPTIVDLLINAVLQQSFGFTIIDERDPYFGFALIIIGLVFNFLVTIRQDQKKKILFSLSLEDDSLYIINDGKLGVELYSVLLEIYELFDKPEFSEKKQLMIGLGYTLTPNEKKVLFKITPHLIKIAEDINKDRIKFFKTHEPNHLPLVICGINIYLHFNKIGENVRKTIRFEREISGYLGKEYGIGKGAYFYERNAPFKIKGIKFFKKSLSFIFHPISEFKRYKFMKYAQMKLDIEGLIVAIAKGKLEKSIGQKRVDELLKKVPQNKEKDFLNFLKMRGLIQEEAEDEEKSNA